MLRTLFKSLYASLKGTNTNSDFQMFCTMDNIYETTSNSTCKVIGNTLNENTTAIPASEQTEYIKQVILPAKGGTIHSEGEPSEVTIPEKVEFEGITYTVTEIGLKAFENCSNLSRISIPETVVSIGSNAFRNCTNLTAVNIPKSVTSIKKNTFYGCSSLSSIDIPDTITSIGECAFFNCNNLTELSLPSKLQSLGSYAFRGCSSIKSLSLPSGITSLGTKTFADCTSLTDIQLPDSLTAVGENVFESCRSLTEITLPARLTSIGNYAFWGCIGMKSISIPNTVTSIGDSAFSGCKSLSAINLPNSLMEMGNNVFTGCKQLSIDNGLLLYANDKKCYGYVGDYKNITEITIPEGVTYINENAFKGCTNLERVYLPNSLTAIGSGAFSMCHKLTDIKLPDSFMGFNPQKSPFAVKYERIKELNKFAVKGFLGKLKKDPGCKYLKLTSCGHACCEISLIYQKVTLWKVVYKITDLADKVEEIKAVAANYEQLYADTTKPE